MTADKNKGGKNFITMGLALFMTLGGITTASPDEAAAQHGIAGKPPAAINMVTESYQVSEVALSFQNGGVDIAFVGTSDFDPELNEYKSGSRQKTIMMLQAKDNGQGIFGTNVRDARLVDVKIDYTEQNVSNRGNISGVITYDERSPIKDVGRVNASPELGTSGYRIAEIHFHGEDVVISINNKATGAQARIEERFIENTTSGPQGQSTLIDYANTSRQVIPQGGSVQFRPVREILSPN